ncbi:MAG: alpha/beta hydrolase [Pseudomonadota bacterium]
MPELVRDDVTLYYERAGNGPPLLLIAGMASDVASWAPIWPMLTARFDVIAYDNRCTGRTRPCPAPVSRPAMIADALALAALFDAPAHMVGHSLGGLTALHLAAEAPERVERLVALSAAPAVTPARMALFRTLAELREATGDEAPWYRLLFHWLFAPAFFADPARVEEAVSLALAYPHAQTAAAFRAQSAVLADFAVPPDLGAIRAPTFAAVGAHDLLVPPGVIDQAFAGIGDLTSRVLPDLAHSLHWEDPAGIAALITGFLEPA